VLKRDVSDAGVLENEENNVYTSAFNAASRLRLG
jgi:hypothetical protein